jgi:hypothetical protein
MLFAYMMLIMGYPDCLGMKMKKLKKLRLDRIRYQNHGQGLKMVLFGIKD